MKTILFAVPGLGEACLNQLVAHDVAPTFVVPPHSSDINRETIIKASHWHDIPVVM